MAPSIRVDIALLPGEAAMLQADCYVVIDVLRATTTIAAFLSRGARAVRVVDTEASARTMARERGALLAGEVGGLPPEGFDMGNSPIEAMSLQLDGRDVVLFTTNGTRALCQASGLGPTFAAALTNGRAVVDHCDAFGHVAFVCAGNGGGTRFSLEDFAVAGAMGRDLYERAPAASAGDGMLLALHALGQDPVGTAAAMMIRDGYHASTLRALGLDADIDFACQPNTMQVVPEVKDFGPGWARLEAAG